MDSSPFFVKSIFEIIDGFCVYYIAWEVVPPSVEPVVEGVTLISSFAVVRSIFDDLELVISAWAVLLAEFKRDSVLIVSMDVIECFNHVTSCSPKF